MGRSQVFAGSIYVLVILLGLRLCYLLVQYVLGGGHVQRFHVESAAALLIVIGACFRLWRQERQTVSVPPSSLWSPYLTVSAFLVLAFALYWRPLSIGFLSDDFGLIDRVATWRVGAVTLELFRPLPLSVWAVILDLGAGAKTIHALNIALHSVNAWLTMHMASEWLGNKWAALSAGLLMTVMPLAPEAVAWSAGVFDVMATTLVIAAVLVSRRYVNGVSYTLRVSFVVLGLLALLAKETAAVVPLLVAVDCWVRKRISRPLILDTAILFVAIGIVAVIRLAMRFGVTTPPLALRFVRRALFRSFGSLAFPWHVDLLAEWPVLPLAVSFVIAALVLAFVLHAGPQRFTRVAIGSSGWILIGILPVFNVFFIGDDLQASRYLYLPSVGWSVLLVTLIWDLPSHRRWSHQFKSALVVFFAIAFAFGASVHLTPWVEAAALRDTVEQGAIRAQKTGSCKTIILSDLPDNNRGAYIFRVNAREELSRALGIDVVVGDEPGPCSFRWREEQLTFVSNNR